MLPLERNYWTLLLLLVIPACTIFGNVLVLMAVRQCERSLRHVTNYIIASLIAVADILLGALVMPFAVYFLVSEGREGQGREGVMPFAVYFLVSRNLTK